MKKYSIPTSKYALLRAKTFDVINEVPLRA